MSVAAILAIIFCTVAGGSIGYLFLWGLLFNTVFGCEYHRNIYKGCISNKEFDALLYVLFTAKDLTYTGYEVKGDKYTVWVANDYYGFRINGVSDFSVYQKYKFFKIWNKLRKTASQDKIKKELDVEKLTMLSSKNGFLIYGKD